MQKVVLYASHSFLQALRDSCRYTKWQSSFIYSYSISKEGKLSNIEILDVEGVFSKKDAKKFIKARTRKTKFEPINFDNKSYEIINLTGEMSLNTRWEDRD